MIDRVGEVFGKLTILQRGDIATGRHYYWVCQCSCGNTTKVIYSNLKSGSVVSCGCHNKEKARKHGGYKHPLYAIWNSMMQRCYNPKNKSYLNYGGRGIDVCDRWHDFNAFVADMKLKPKGKSMDRINNDLGYSPENCRWADTLMQANNKTTNNCAVIDGEKLTLSQISRDKNIRFTTLHDRIYKSGMTLSEAINTPLATPMKHCVGNGLYMTVSEIAKIVGTKKETINVRIRKGVVGEDLLKPLREYAKHEVNGEYLTVGEISKKYNVKVATVKQRLKYGKRGVDLISQPKK